MSLGVFTAGARGAHQEFALLGAVAHADAETIFRRVGDLDDPGVFVWSDATDWEVQITSLATTRRDEHGKREIRNTLVFHGMKQSSDDRQDSQLAVCVGELALTAQGRDALATAVDQVLPDNLVGRWFEGTWDGTAGLRTALNQLTSPGPSTMSARSVGASPASGSDPAGVEADFLQVLGEALDSKASCLAVWGTVFPGVTDIQGGVKTVLLIRTGDDGSTERIDLAQDNPSQDAELAPESESERAGGAGKALALGAALLLILFIALTTIFK